MTMERWGYMAPAVDAADLILSGELGSPNSAPNKEIAKISDRTDAGKAVVLGKGQVIGTRLIVRGWLTDVAHQIAFRHGQTEQFAEQHASQRTVDRLAYLTDACVEANRRDISALGR